MTGGTGSYLYMAGEVCRHEPYNDKVDVYSFAMILYEMVTGERPFRGMAPVKAAQAAATDGLRPTFAAEPPRHFTAEERELVPRVHALIARCWEAYPMARCASSPGQYGTLACKHRCMSQGGGHGRPGDACCRPSFSQIVPQLEEMLSSFQAPRPRYADQQHAAANATRGFLPALLSRNSRSSEFASLPGASPLAAAFLPARISTRLQQVGSAPNLRAKLRNTRARSPTAGESGPLSDGTPAEDGEVTQPLSHPLVRAPSGAPTVIKRRWPLTACIC